MATTLSSRLNGSQYMQKDEMQKQIAVSNLMKQFKDSAIYHLKDNQTISNTGVSTVKQAIQMSQGYVVVDIETAGLNLNAPILQVSAIAYDVHGKPETIFDQFVQPYYADAQQLLFTEAELAQTSPADLANDLRFKGYEIHRISYEQVMSGKEITQVVNELIRFIQGRLVVGHNIQFDADHLNYTVRQLQMMLDQPIDDTFNIFKGKVFDSMFYDVMMRDQVEPGVWHKWRKVEELADEFGIQQADVQRQVYELAPYNTKRLHPHDSLFDSLLEGETFARLIELA